MPLSNKDKKMKRNFDRQYGSRGKDVYYATLNKHISEGHPIDSPESKKMAKRRKHGKSKRKARRHRR